jgi:mono/diheme cytochrome c family protein
MNEKRNLELVFLLALLGMITGMSQAIAQTLDTQTVDRGRYLVKIAGCNDCHTPGYLLSEGKTPEELWLTGDTFGWRGPWGTTYGPNLRIFVPTLTEDQWVIFAKNLRTRPTMAWFNLNKMKDEDLRAIYQYIRYLGPGGKPAPQYLPPDKEPDPPYALFPLPPSQ